MERQKIDIIDRIKIVEAQIGSTLKEKDIVPKYSLTYYTSPHQYLQVRIGKMKEIDLENDKFVNVDIWGAANGIKFGDYANGFFKSK